MTRCDCGRWHGSAEDVQRLCKCGRRVLVEPEEQEPWGFGDQFRHDHPELFGGRQCKCSDAVGLMNHWGREKSIENVDRLAGLLGVGRGSLARALAR